MTHRLPAASAWDVVSGRVASIGAARWQVHGDGVPGRYQLVSPKLDVSANRRITLRLDVARALQVIEMRGI